jgi:cytochrome c-type biogenesis protein CcmH/NrfF
MRAALIAGFMAIATIAAAAPHQGDRGTIVEQRLMQNLACTCPTCNLEPIERCQCDQAKKMRGEVTELLRGVDISAPDKREAAYQHVREVFAAKYGASVLTPNEKRTDPRMNWLPIIIFVGWVVLLVFVMRRSIKRRRES